MKQQFNKTVFIVLLLICSIVSYAQTGTNSVAVPSQAIDFKNMNQISAIFEIYKTKSEQYLNSNGRNWKQLYKAYADAVKVKKKEITIDLPVGATGR